LLLIKVKVNTSPFSGQDGEKYTFAHLKERLTKEAGIDAALKVDIMSNELYVYGRGDLH